MPRPKKYPTKLLLGLTDEQLAHLDHWRRSEDDLPTRSEAIRRLLDAALASTNRKKGR